MGERNAILDAAVTIVADALRRAGVALASPVRAAFRTDARGSTGVEITVRLEDPAESAAARSVISSRFGGECHGDVIDVA
jgi:hypothetical protein